MIRARPFRLAALVTGLAGSSACTDSVEPKDAVKPVDSIPVPPNYGVHDTFVRDGILFVCAWNTGLLVYDVGNGIKGGSPAAPVQISTIVTGPAAGDPQATVHNAWWFQNPATGEKKYVFVGQEGPATIGQSSTGDIHVVDVSDLTQPREVAFYHMGGTPQAAGTHNFWVDEPAQVLYAAFYNGGVVALDVSGTLSGDLAGREIARVVPATGAFVWGVQLYQGSLYVTDMITGFYQLRLSGTTLSVVSGGGNVPERYLSDLWVQNGYAYTGTWGSRGSVPGNALKIWRLSASGAPVLADSIVVDSVGTVSDVQVSLDNRLLMFSSERGPGGGVHFYSLAEPARPKFLTKVGIPAGVHTATLADINGRRYLFAAKNPGTPADPKVLIYDVTLLAP